MDTFRRQAALFCAVLALMPAGPASAAAPSYNLVDLGTLSGNGSKAYAIGSNGAVAGMSEVAGKTDIQNTHGFLWFHNQMMDVGTFGGAAGEAEAVNGSGQVTGWSQLGSGYNKHAFLWSGAALPPTDLGTLGGDNSAGYGINNGGTVVGESCITPSSSFMHAFKWRAGVMHDIGTLGGIDSGARAVNGIGEVVGYSDTTARAHHAFLWNNGTMIDLGTLGGPSSGAYAINDTGLVVGDSLIDAGASHRHAFLWNGRMVDLAPFGSEYSSARGINSAGDVVGYAETPTGAFGAFLYHQGAAYYLNDLLSTPSNITITYAYAINDAGQICGIGKVNGAPHAVLLVPTALAPSFKTAASATPNPVTGKTTTLSALGSDAGAGAEPTLIYTWSETSGPAVVAFSANGTNGARNNKATFTQAGAYTLTVTIANTFGQSTRSSVNVTVDQTVTSIAMAPAPALTINPPLPHEQQFTAKANDQFGNALSPQPVISWSLASGSVGSISSSGGLYHSGSKPGTATVKARAANGAVSASCAVTVK